MFSHHFLSQTRHAHSPTDSHSHTHTPVRVLRSNSGGATSTAAGGALLEPGTPRVLNATNAVFGTCFITYSHTLRGRRLEKYRCSGAPAPATRESARCACVRSGASGPESVVCAVAWPCVRAARLACAAGRGEVLYGGGHDRRVGEPVVVYEHVCTPCKSRGTVVLDARQQQAVCLHYL